MRKTESWTRAATGHAPLSCCYCPHRREGRIAHRTHGGLYPAPRTTHDRAKRGEQPWEGQESAIERDCTGGIRVWFGRASVHSAAGEGMMSWRGGGRDRQPQATAAARRTHAPRVPTTSMAKLSQSSLPHPQPSACPPPAPAPRRPLSPPPPSNSHPRPLHQRPSSPSKVRVGGAGGVKGGGLLPPADHGLVHRQPRYSCPALPTKSTPRPPRSSQPPPPPPPPPPDGHVRKRS